jgi:hypothetical protein
MFAIHMFAIHTKRGCSDKQQSLCVRDLRTYAEAIDGEVSHYRDERGLECDCGRREAD